MKRKAKERRGEGGRRERINRKGQEGRGGGRGGLSSGQVQLTLKLFGFRVGAPQCA